MKHTAFFGDATYTFALTDTVTIELQRLTGVGAGALYLRMVNSQFYVSDMTQIIRLGLIGGGVSPEKAHTLVDTYVKDRPFAEIVPLALDILDARWNGTPERVEPAVWINEDDLRHAATTGDLAAALNEAAA